MNRFPILLDEKPTGELTVSEAGLYVCFDAVCFPPEMEPFHLFAVGEQGELRLGVPVPENGRFMLHRRLSTRESAATGRLKWGELRLCDEVSCGDWQPVKRPGQMFHSPFLRESLRRAAGALTRQEGQIRFLALPFDRHSPFWLTGMFCFARVRWIGGKEYVAFAFDWDENPVFR